MTRSKKNKTNRRTAKRTPKSKTAQKSQADQTGTSNQPTTIVPSLALMFETSEKVLEYRQGVDTLREELQNRQQVLSNTLNVINQLEVYLTYLKANKDKAKVDTLGAFLEKLRQQQLQKQQEQQEQQQQKEQSQSQSQSSQPPQVQPPVDETEEDEVEEDEDDMEDDMEDDTEDEDEDENENDDFSEDDE